MAITEAQLSSPLATCLIPGILREAGVTDAQDVEDFFRSRVRAQLVDAGTGMWEFGAVTLAEAWRMERYRQAKGLTPREVADVFRDHGLSQVFLDNYYLYHIESPAHMIADLDSYRLTGKPLDVEM